MAQKKKIPNATMKRLPLYYRFFKSAKSLGIDRVSSKEISEGLDIDPATIRRDFSYFGELGRKGYGYNVKALLNFYTENIQGNKERKVAVVGVGNLGNALLNYDFQKINDKINIVTAFDIDDKIIGKVINGIEVLDYKVLDEEMKNRNIDVAILTVPGQVGQEVAKDLENAGVRGILNFSPERLELSNRVYVHNIDVSLEMQTLFYLMQNN